MIIEVDIVTLEVRVNGTNVCETTMDKMHNMRDFAREHLNVKGNSTYYTILDGKIASQHDVSNDTAEYIMDYLVRD